MPSLIDLRRRIRSVKSTQQITKAMKMVASSRLRKAQDRVLGARPFARFTMDVLASLASRVDHSAHPLLAQRPDTPDARSLLIVIAADKGLCGAFNTNIMKEALRHLAERRQRPVCLGLVGRKSRDFFRRRGVDIRFERINVFQRLDESEARTIAALAIDEFASGAVDRVDLVFNEFKSILQQRVVVQQLLPIKRLPPPDPQALPVEYLYEPDPKEIFEFVLPRYVEIEIWQALLESSAAEHAARMTAMDSATKNAGEMIDSLTLYMNKIRQASITREIIEVVSGAEAI
jgi:F-type H+-transporting ATPase subunit gamma